MLNQDISLDSLLFSNDSRLNATGNPIVGYGRKNINEVRGRRRK
jgi:hypothetical protein